MSHLCAQALAPPPKMHQTSGTHITALGKVASSGKRTVSYTHLTLPKKAEV